MYSNKFIGFLQSLETLARSAFCARNLILLDIVLMVWWKIDLHRPAYNNKPGFPNKHWDVFGTSVV